jgi:hypothetical protein
MDDEAYVIIAPNDDGRGPSSLAYHLAHAILTQQTTWRVILVTGQKSFNNIYKDIRVNSPWAQRVDVVEVPRMSWLPRDTAGLIDRVETLEVLKRYPQQRLAYKKALSQSNVLKDRRQKICLAIDIGVPSMALWADELNIPLVTVFDHSWSLTFQAIWLEQKPNEDLRAALDILEKDEAAAKQVFLFPPPGTASEYWKHWERVSGVFPSDI